MGVVRYVDTGYDIAIDTERKHILYQRKSAKTLPASVKNNRSTIRLKL